MCGRFSLTTPVEAARQVFGFSNTPNLQPHWNIAPTMEAAIVRLTPDGAARDLSMLRWGLVPHWARDSSGAARMINARADTVAEKPAFRAAFAKRRCLVLSDGFYEWTAGGNDGPGKQAWRITSAEGQPFAFAGLWEGWKAPDQSWLKTFTIVTTDAAQSIAHIHARMPVILGSGDIATWLDADAREEDLRSLLKPCPSEFLHSYRVSSLVNSVKNDNPACFAPMAA